MRNEQSRIRQLNSDGWELAEPIGVHFPSRVPRPCLAFLWRDRAGIVNSPRVHLKVKIPILPQRTRQGWGTPSFIQISKPCHPERKRVVRFANDSPESKDPCTASASCAASRHSHRILSSLCSFSMGE